MLADSDEVVRREFTIIYATETGNALDVAERIMRETKRRHFLPHLSSVDAYPLEDLISESLVIFVVSTTGSGVEPRSMRQLWSMLLRSDLPHDLFDGLHYAVFGLGDTAYEKFCWPAKKLDRRLEGLGGHRLLLRGEGDDQHRLGIEGTLDPWITALCEELLSLHPLPPYMTTLPENLLLPPKLSLQFEKNHNLTDPMTRDKSKHGPLYHQVTVRVNKRITDSEWFQEVRHIELDLAEDVKYRPGDVAVIYPEADADDVEAFLQVADWNSVADVPLKVMIDPACPWPSSVSLPVHTTMRQLLSRHLDFNAVPRRSFFELIRHFAADDLEKEKLEDFCSAEGQDDFYEYCQKVRRTVLEVLTEFKSVRIPIEYAFDALPPLRPRQFSISSSVRCHPKQVHLCVAIVQYRTRLRKIRRGTCTRYLASLLPGTTLQIGIEEGTLRLPEDNSVPVICIGPGTGVAPMRSVLEERVARGAKDNTLYFGCRSATSDQHYADEWSHLNDIGSLVYRVACSRDGAHGQKRKYVQDLIKEDDDRINALLDVGRAWIYISGSSNKMPKAVKEALAMAMVGASAPQAELEKFVKRIESEGRLYEECWS